MMAMDMVVVVVVVVVVTHLALEVDIAVEVMLFQLRVMIASNVAALDIGLVNALIQMEVAELEGTLLLQGMVVELGDVVTALGDQIVLLAMMMIDMMVGATWTAAGIHIMVLGVIVMLVIAMHQQQIAILVTGIVVQIVTHQVALPGKGAMKEMEGGPAEVTTVMNLGALAGMAEVVLV
ncbi:unnamed protein product [Urochloa humidicola]